MKKTIHSFGHALSGLDHAVKNETNLRRFLLAYLCVLLVSIWLDVDIISIVFVLICGAMFIIVELINTAIERLADTVDDHEKKKNGGHYHLGIKMTKDVGAAGSLIALMIYSCSVISVFIVHMMSTFQGL